MAFIMDAVKSTQNNVSSERWCHCNEMFFPSDSPECSEWCKLAEKSFTEKLESDNLKIEVKHATT